MTDENRVPEDEPVPAFDAESFDGNKYISLTTFRRDGTPVACPVWFAVGDGRVYVTTEAGRGKVKRLRNDTSVRFAACDFNGRVNASAVSYDGTARFLPEDEVGRPRSLLRAKYGVMMRIVEVVTNVQYRLKRKEREDLFLEITVAG